MALPFNYDALKCKDWTRVWRWKALQKCPNGQVMAIFARSPKPAFSEDGQRGDQGKFFKNRPKGSPRLKNPEVVSRKWHYPLICTNLTCKEWKWFWRKQRLQKFPDAQVMAIFWKVTQNPLFLKKCKGGTKGNFSKIAQKVALVWKAQKHSGANGIIL